MCACNYYVFFSRQDTPLYERLHNPLRIWCIGYIPEGGRVIHRCSYVGVLFVDDVLFVNAVYWKHKGTAIIPMTSYDELFYIIAAIFGLTENPALLSDSRL